MSSSLASTSGISEKIPPPPSTRPPGTVFSVILGPNGSEERERHLWPKRCGSRLTLSDGMMSLIKEVLFHFSVLSLAHVSAASSTPS